MGIRRIGRGVYTGNRVIRGGSWNNNDVANLRSASRNNNTPTNRNGCVTFDHRFSGRMMGTSPPGPIGARIRRNRPFFAGNHRHRETLANAHLAFTCPELPGNCGGSTLRETVGQSCDSAEKQPFQPLSWRLWGRGVRSVNGTSRVARSVRKQVIQGREDEVRPPLRCEVPDGKTPRAVEGKEIVAGKIEPRAFVWPRVIEKDVTEPPKPVVFGPKETPEQSPQHGVVDTRKELTNVEPKAIRMGAARPCGPREGTVGATPRQAGVGLRHEGVFDPVGEATPSPKRLGRRQPPSGVHRRIGVRISADSTVTLARMPGARGNSRHPRGNSRHSRGVSQLPRGVSQLPRGVSQLPRGVSRHPRGVSQLPRGVSQLPRGVSQLPRGEDWAHEMRNPLVLTSRMGRQAKGI